jgi:hypothetical protein
MLQRSILAFAGHRKSPLCGSFMTDSFEVVYLTTLSVLRLIGECDDGMIPGMRNRSM